MKYSTLPLALALLGATPGAAWADAVAPAAPPIPPAALHPSEVHLRNLRQVTFGGENAEAYWSFDGAHLSLQSTSDKAGDADRCDQIYVQDVPPLGSPLPLSPARRLTGGLGRHTCSFFFPDGNRILFSSTRQDGNACPPPPDRSKGYVWPLYHYQIYSARLDGGDVRRITQSKGYDAEATVCRDGSVIFTSDRDGDLELYRMRLDGSGVTRLTHAPGYDGGAFFSEDCKRIVWRADHPRNDKELGEMKDLLGKRLVRPSRMELWVANADGSDAHQVTDLGVASFAPFFEPASVAGAPDRRILFSSNYPDPRGREFDIWAINSDGTNLERITYTPEFDGFPMFSPDGKRLAFSSNRGGKHRGETNVYLADWVEPETGKGKGRLQTTPQPADVARTRVSWLADPARQGRGVGTPGLAAAAEEIARWMKQEGLAPAGEAGKSGPTYFQPVDVFVGVRDTGSRFTLDGKAVPPSDLVPSPISESGPLSGELVFAGYGITAPEAKWDDLAKQEGLKGRVAVVLRGVPEKRLTSAASRSYSDLRYKAWNLREHGAAAVVFVDPEFDGVPRLVSDGPEGGAGLPVVFASRTLIAGLLAQATDGLRPLQKAAEAGQAAGVKLRGTLGGQVSLARDMRHERNVVGVLRATGTASGVKAPAVVLGAHYDHLGLGGRGSFLPDQQVVHPGADDNASGTTALLQAAAFLRGAAPRRSPTVGPRRRRRPRRPARRTSTSSPSPARRSAWSAPAASPNTGCPACPGTACGPC